MNDVIGLNRFCDSAKNQMLFLTLGFTNSAKSKNETIDDFPIDMVYRKIPTIIENKSYFGYKCIISIA